MGVNLEKTTERLNSGDERIILGTILCILNIGLMNSGRASWQEEEDKRKDFTGRNLIDPTLQDNVIFQSNFFQYILSCRMCNQFTFHHKFRMDTGRSNFEQKTDSILSACESCG